MYYSGGVNYLAALACAWIWLWTRTRIGIRLWIWLHQHKGHTESLHSYSGRLQLGDCGIARWNGFDSVSIGVSCIDLLHNTRTCFLLQHASRSSYHIHSLPQHHHQYTPRRLTYLPTTVTKARNHHPHPSRQPETPSLPRTNLARHSTHLQSPGNPAHNPTHIPPHRETPTAQQPTGPATAGSCGGTRTAMVARRGGGGTSERASETRVEGARDGFGFGLMRRALRLGGDWGWAVSSRGFLGV